MAEDTGTMALRKNRMPVMRKYILFSVIFFISVKGTVLSVKGTVLLTLFNLSVARSLKQ